jgi:hypothetical protein
MHFTLPLALLMLACAAAHAQEPVALPCKAGDEKCAFEARGKSPVRNKSYWAEALAKPLEQRIGVAPDELLIYLNLDNIASGLSNRPRAVQIPADFSKDVSDAVAELPSGVKALVEKKLVGIYFVKDLGGTGFTDYVHGGWFSSDAGFIALDMDVLARQTANAWATWKENTPFIANASIKLDAQIENEAGDNRKNAIQYILLHELGHIISIGEDIHPRWDGPASSVDKFPFARLSWKFEPGNRKYFSRYDDSSFGERSEVRYYFGPTIAAKRMLSVYEKLLGTNFPTLYAATHPGDDFAESFVTYVHTVMQKRPWEIRMSVDGKIASTYRACWDEKRCAEKRKILEGILGVGE